MFTLGWYHRVCNQPEPHPDLYLLGVPLKFSDKHHRPKKLGVIPFTWDLMIILSKKILSINFVSTLKVRTLFFCLCKVDLPALKVLMNQIEEPHKFQIHKKFYLSMLSLGGVVGRLGI